MAVRVDWDATRYAERVPKKTLGAKPAEKKESHLRLRFPPRDGLMAGITMSSPCIVVDMHNVILAWYLPGILDASRQVSLFILSDHHGTLMYFRKT